MSVKMHSEDDMSRFMRRQYRPHYTPACDFSLFLDGHDSFDTKSINSLKIDTYGVEQELRTMTVTLRRPEGHVESIFEYPKISRSGSGHLHIFELDSTIDLPFTYDDCWRSPRIELDVHGTSMEFTFELRGVRFEH